MQRNPDVEQAQRKAATHSVPKLVMEMSPLSGFNKNNTSFDTVWVVVHAVLSALNVTLMSQPLVTFFSSLRDHL